MARCSKEQVKNDEMKILAELQKNSNEQIETIAKHLGFSRQKTWKLIKRLEEDHMIWGYTIVVDQQKQGLQKFILFQKRTKTPYNPEDIEEFVTTRFERKKKELGVTVQSTYFIHSEYEWVTIFTAEDIVQAKKFADAITQRFPGTQSIQLSQILFTLREQYIENPNPMKRIITKFLNNYSLK